MQFAISGYTLAPLGFNTTGNYERTFLYLNIILILPHSVFYSYALYKVAKNLGITRYLKAKVVVLISKMKSFKRHFILKFTRNVDDYQPLDGVSCEESLSHRLKYPRYYLK